MRFIFTNRLILFTVVLVSFVLLSISGYLCLAQNQVALTTIVPGGTEQTVNELKASRMAVGNVDGIFDYKTVDPIPENSLIIAGNLGVCTADVSEARLTLRCPILKEGSAILGVTPSQIVSHMNLGENSTTGVATYNMPFCTIRGGSGNLASLEHATVGGGVNNKADVDNSYTTEYYPTVIGGQDNIARATGSTVGGGMTNKAEEGMNIIGGGDVNSADGSLGAAIGGGRSNEADGQYATVQGGEDNNANGRHSWTGGRNMNVTGRNSFAWGYSTSPVTISEQSVFIIFPDAGSGRVLIGATSYSGSYNPALYIDGDIFYTGQINPPDYVFEPDHGLESIEEHAKFMWENKHLPAIPKMEKSEDGKDVLNVTVDQRGILEELEKAHIYISQLKEILDEQEKTIAALEKTLETR